MKKIWVHKSYAFSDADAFSDVLNRLSSYKQRLSDIQFCRECYFKLKGIYENRKRLRRSVKVIKRK